MGDGLLVYFGYPTAHEDDAHVPLDETLERNAAEVSRSSVNGACSRGGRSELRSSSSTTCRRTRPYRCAQRRQRVAGVSEKSRPGERHTDAGLAHSRASPDVGSAAPATKLVRRASQRPFTPVDALNGLSTPRRLHRADRPFIRPPRSAHRDHEANGLDQPSAAGMPRAARAKAFSVKDASGSARSANSSASPRACA